MPNSKFFLNFCGSKQTNKQTNCSYSLTNNIDATMSFKISDNNTVIVGLYEYLLSLSLVAVTKIPENRNKHYLRRHSYNSQAHILKNKKSNILVRWLKWLHPIW